MSGVGRGCKQMPGAQDPDPSCCFCTGTRKSGVYRLLGDGGVGLGGRHDNSLGPCFSKLEQLFLCPDTAAPSPHPTKQGELFCHGRL